MRKTLLVVVPVIVGLIAVGGMLWSVMAMSSILHESTVQGSCDGFGRNPSCIAWVKVSEEPQGQVRAWVDYDNRHFNEISLFVEIVDGSGRRVEKYDGIVDPRIDTWFWTCSVKKVEVLDGGRLVQTVVPEIKGGCPQWVIDRRE